MKHLFPRTVRPSLLRLHWSLSADAKLQQIVSFWHMCEATSKSTSMYVEQLSSCRKLLSLSKTEDGFWKQSNGCFKVLDGMCVHRLGGWILTKCNAEERDVTESTEACKGHWNKTPGCAGYGSQWGTCMLMVDGVELNTVIWGAIDQFYRLSSLLFWCYLFLKTGCFFFHFYREEICK